MEVNDDFDPNSMRDRDENGVISDVEEFQAMGINPSKSTRAKPGTDEKVLMLSARYAAGVPLWHERDCYAHGPKERELMGVFTDSLPQPLPLPETHNENW